MIMRTVSVWMLLKCKVDGARDNIEKEGGDQIILRY